MLPVDVFLKSIKFIKIYNRYNPLRLIINRLFIIPLRKILITKIDGINPDNLINDIFTSKPNIIVFDQAWNSFYNKLCHYSEKNQIVTVSVPHGHNTLANELIWSNSMDIAPHTSKIQSPSIYNYVVYENDIIANRYMKMGLVTKKQICVIGSSRFSNEWLKKLESILPKLNFPKLDNKVLKVVFMLTKSKYNGHPDEVERTIEYISKFPDIYLIVKPHTRGMKFHKTFSSNVQIVDNEFHSPLLINWADVVLFTMTSVIYDCLKKDKPVLYMKNTHSNKLLSENYFNTWEVHCRDDLRDFILKLKENKQFRTYSKQDRDKYCKTMIEPYGDDVLDQYNSFLINLL